MPQLMKTTKEIYAERLPEILKKHAIKNRLAGPRIDKVVLSMGVGRAIADGQILNVVTEHLTLIAGQRASVTKAKKAVANFRSRIGVKVGCHVTLRSARMWAFDGRGNYNMGLREQALFHEVQLDKLEHNQGLNITICIRNSTDAISFDLLKALSMPFREITVAPVKAPKPVIEAAAPEAPKPKPAAKPVAKPAPKK